MAKITYQDKVDLYENANVQHINKVIADDMNEIKDAVNDNETKILIAVSDTAPSTCAKDDLYYNTTQNKIFVATATNTWSSTGTTPTENTIYILFDTKTTYSYDGNSLVSIGGGEDEIAISTSEPTEHEKLWINPNKLVKAYGTYISNTHGTSQTIGYSQEYLNNSIVEKSGDRTNGYIKYGNGIMIQWSTIEGTQGTLSSWGSLYYQDISMGNWNTAFTSLYNVEISNMTNQFWCSLNGVSTTSKGNARIVRPDTGFSGASYIIQILAVGTWK